MDKLVAQVQYGDWKGTTAADNADMNGIDKLLRDRGLLQEGQVLVGIRAYIGDHGDQVRDPSIEALLVDGQGFDDVKGYLASTPDPLKLKRVRVELSLNEFLGLFKRIDIVLTRSGLNLTNRQYVVNE